LPLPFCLSLPKGICCPCSVNHAWVPHPRHALVFVARVGNHKSQPSLCFSVRHSRTRICFRLCYPSTVDNLENLAKLKEGVTVWNSWLEQNPDLQPDLSDADLSEANLFSVNLSGARLIRANLSQANVVGANLSRSNLSGAILTGADFFKSNLRSAELFEANLTRAKLFHVDLFRADLRGANLLGANLRHAKLNTARLNNAILIDTDLRSANLQATKLDGASLNGAKLWETQRAGWSIKDVICERVYWDKEAENPTEYEPGEFERLHSEQTTIELRYPGGLSTFELSTLPALLHHLSQKHDGVTIRLRNVEQSGGGVKVTLTLGDADGVVKAQVESEAAQLVQMQLKFREDEALRLQIENTTLKQLHETTIRMMLTASAPQAHFYGPVGIAALPSGSATVQVNQSADGNAELIQFLEKLLTYKADLSAAQATEIEAAKVELQKSSPDKSVLSRSLDFIKTLPKEVLLKGAGKVGERLAEADYSNLLDQLGEFIRRPH